MIGWNICGRLYYCVLYFTVHVWRPLLPNGIQCHDKLASSPQLSTCTYWVLNFDGREEGKKKHLSTTVVWRHLWTHDSLSRASFKTQQPLYLNCGVIFQFHISLANCIFVFFQDDFCRGRGLARGLLLFFTPSSHEALGGKLIKMKKRSILPNGVRTWGYFCLIRIGDINLRVSLKFIDPWIHAMVVYERARMTVVRALF